MFNRIRRMIIKELLQVLRDPRARFGLIIPPILQILIYGYAATFELHQVRMAVLDLDHSYESRDLVDRFTSSHHFRLAAVLNNRKQIADAIDRGKVTLAVQVLPGFAETLRKGDTAHVQVILDGTDSNTALVALGYINQITGDYGAEYARDRLERAAPSLASRLPSVELARRPWFNPDLDSRWFFIPGTIGSLLLTSVLTVAVFAIVREREVGTLEQVMVSPISRFEFIIGKMAPPFVIAMGQLLLMMAIGPLWFDVPFRGSVLILAAGSSIFIMSVIGVSILLSTISATQQQAMIAAFFFIMPAITLSGFSFPISSMPAALQWITYADPLRYFLVIIRDTFLKGNGMDVLWPQFAALFVIAAVLLGLSTLRFQKSLD
jgi:ABC-2 type transport system permease protein